MDSFDRIKKGGTGLKIGTLFKVKKSVTEDHIFIHVSRADKQVQRQSRVCLPEVVEESKK